MIKKRTSLFCVLLLLSLMLATPVVAQTPSGSGGQEISTAGDEAPADDTIDFEDYTVDVIDYTLPNGLRVILAEDHSAPVVAVDLWYQVGAANDPPERSGFAHMFEHMMFRGSENVADGEFDAWLESVGPRKNAYTAADQTAYWEVAPANQLPLMLWLESDRMRSLNITQEIFETERGVVIEEYNQRVANRPYGVSGRKLTTLPMQGYPPYERPVIGNIDNLQAAEIEELQEFHDTFYKPNNATLVIVGDIDPELTQALVQAYFADIPAGEELTPMTDTYPLPAEFPVLRVDEHNGCNIGYEETLVDGLVELPRHIVTVVGPPRGEPDFYPLSLLIDILGSGDSSRLEQNVVRQGQAASAFAGLVDFLGGSVLYAGAFPNQGDTLESSQELIRAEFDQIIDAGVTEAELARVKQQKLIGSITSFRESALNTAEWLQNAVLTFDDPDAIVDELTRYEAVTVEDIQRVAQTYLCERPMNTLNTIPDGEEVIAEYPGLLVEPVTVVSGDETASNPVDIELTDEILANIPEGVISRTEPPAALPVSESQFPPFEQFTLDNGLHGIFVQQTEVPKINLSLYTGGSDPAVPAEKHGIVDIAVELLTKGTTNRTAAEIAEAIESVGGSVSSSSALEWTELSVDAPSPESDLAFDLLADMARNSIFPENEFEIIKDQTLTFLEQSEVNPDTLANRQFGRLAYGGHPYGNYTSAETVEPLTRDDAVEFYETFYNPNNALLVIVGDTTLEEAQAQTERVFGDWQSGEVPDYLDYPEAVLGDTSAIYVVDRPGSEQATIQIGNMGINARNPDRYAVTVLNTVLGSGSTSRLYRNLRDEKGLTYGVYSRFGQPHDTSTFRVLTDVDQDKAGEAIREILKELETIRTEEIPEEELTDAKGLLIGNFALSIEDPADFAGRLSSRYLMGLPLDELNSYLSELEQVSATAALAAANKYIDSEQPIIVVVGDAETLQPQLEEFGNVMVVDGDGNPLAE